MYRKWLLPAVKDMPHAPPESIIGQRVAVSPACLL